MSSWSGGGRAKLLTGALKALAVSHLNALMCGFLAALAMAAAGKQVYGLAGLMAFLSSLFAWGCVSEANLERGALQRLVDAESSDADKREAEQQQSHSADAVAARMAGGDARADDRQEDWARGVGVVEPLPEAGARESDSENESVLVADGLQFHGQRTGGKRQTDGEDRVIRVLDVEATKVHAGDSCCVVSDSQSHDTTGVPGSSAGRTLVGVVHFEALEPEPSRHLPDRSFER